MATALEVAAAPSELTAGEAHDVSSAQDTAALGRSVDANVGLLSDEEFSKQLDAIRDGTPSEVASVALLLLLEDDRAHSAYKAFRRRVARERADFGLQYRLIIGKLHQQMRRDKEDNDFIRSKEMQRLRRMQQAAVAVGASIARHESLTAKVVPQSSSRAWWEECSDPDFPADLFHKAFRMRKRTFRDLCNILAPMVVKKTTRIREAVPVKQRVASCLWRLATAEPLHKTSKKFGLGQTTAHFIFADVCKALIEILLPQVGWLKERSGLHSPVI